MTDTTDTDLLERAETHTNKAELTATYRIVLFDHDLTTLFDVGADDIDRDYAKRVAERVAHKTIERHYGVSVGTSARTVVEQEDVAIGANGLTHRTFTVAVIGVRA